MHVHIVCYRPTTSCGYIVFPTGSCMPNITFMGAFTSKKQRLNFLIKNKFRLTCRSMSSPFGCMLKHYMVHMFTIQTYTRTQFNNNNKKNAQQANFGNECNSDSCLSNSIEFPKCCILTTSLSSPGQDLSLRNLPSRCNTWDDRIQDSPIWEDSDPLWLRLNHHNELIQSRSHSWLTESCLVIQSVCLYLNLNSDDWWWCTWL